MKKNDASVPFGGCPGEVSVIINRLDSQQINGKRILDVGAGYSGAAALLTEMGGDAYAVDPLYADQDDFAQAVRINLNDLGEHLDDRHTLETAMFSARQFDYGNKKFPNRLIAASSDDLPFADESFDIVLALNSTSIYQAATDEELSRHLREELRVTKRGGTVRLSPWHSDAEPDQEARIERRQRVAAAMLQLGEIEQIDQYDIEGIVTAVHLRKPY